MLFTSLLLALAVSIDALGIGITYGIRDTKISNISKYVLFFIFFIVAVLSTFFGSLLNNLFSPFVSNFIGFIILVFMGLWIIYTTITPKKLNKSKPKNKKRILRISKRWKSQRNSNNSHNNLLRKVLLF